jgi:hypothetical protein
MFRDETNVKRTSLVMTMMIMMFVDDAGVISRTENGIL